MCERKPSVKQVFDALTGGDEYDCPDWAPDLLDRASPTTVALVRDVLRDNSVEEEAAHKLGIRN